MSLTVEPVVSQLIQSTAAHSQSDVAAICVICQAQAAKYKCPGCKAQTCSLSCCTAHKSKSKCSGKRSREEFVALSDYDEQTMMSDYRLLEDVSDLQCSLQKSRTRDAHETGNRQTINRVKKDGQELLKAAARCRIDLKFMPTGMQRQQINTSYFSRRDRCICWHLELRFPLVEVTVHLERVIATTSLEQALQMAFSWKDGHAARSVKLAAFVDATPAQCEVLLQRELIPATQDKMKRIRIDDTVQDALTGECVVEYPVFVVQLRQDRAAGGEEGPSSVQEPLRPDSNATAVPPS